MTGGPDKRRVLAPFRGAIARAASAALLLRVVNLFLGLTTTVILGGVLGAEGFGVYAVGLAAAAIVAGLSQSGLSPQILKAAAAAKELSDWAALNGARRMAAIAPLLLAGIVSAPAIYVIAVVADGAGSPYWIAAALGGVIAPFALADACANALLRGIGKSAIAFAPRFVIMQSAYLILVLGCMQWATLTPVSALLCFIAAWVIALGAAWCWIVRAWPAPARRVKPRLDGRQWRRSVFYTTIAGIGGILFGHVETFALSAFASPVEVGLYAMAFRFAQFVSFPVFALSSGLAPVATAAIAAGRLEEARRKTILAARTAAAAAGAGAVFLAIIGAHLFPAIHADFSGAYWIMNILAAGLVFQATLGYPLIFIVIYGAEKTASLVAAIVTIVGLCFITLLTALFGAHGAATAGALSGAALILSRWVVLYRLTGIRNDIFAAPEKSSAPIAHPANA